MPWTTELSYVYHLVPVWVPGGVHDWPAQHLVMHSSIPTFHLSADTTPPSGRYCHEPNLTYTVV